MIFGAYSVALVLLLATDLDQRLLPNELTLPAIPIALVRRPRRPQPAVPLDRAAARDRRSRSSCPGSCSWSSIPFGAGAIGQGDLKLLVSVGLLAGPFRLFSA